MVSAGITWYLQRKRLKDKEAAEEQAKEAAESEIKQLEQESLQLQIEQSGFQEGIDGVNGLPWEALGFPERLCH